MIGSLSVYSSSFWFKPSSTLLLLLTITSINHSQSSCPIEMASIIDSTGQPRSVYDWNPGTSIIIKLKGYPESFVFSQPGLGSRPWYSNPENRPQFQQVLCQDLDGTLTEFYDDIGKFHKDLLTSDPKIEWLGEQCTKPPTKKQFHPRYLLCPLKLWDQVGCVIWAKESWRLINRIVSNRTQTPCIPINHPFCDFEKIVQKSTRYCTANGGTAEVKTECEYGTGKPAATEKVIGILNSPQVNCSALDLWRKMEKKISGEEANVTIPTCGSSLKNFQGTCNLTYSQGNLEYTVSTPPGACEKEWTVDISDEMRNKTLLVQCHFTRKHNNHEWIHVNFSLESEAKTGEKPIIIWSRKGMAILLCLMVLVGIMCFIIGFMIGWRILKRRKKKEAEMKKQKEKRKRKGKGKGKEGEEDEDEDEEGKGETVVASTRTKKGPLTSVITWAFGRKKGKTEETVVKEVGEGDADAAETKKKDAAKKPAKTGDDGGKKKGAKDGDGKTTAPMTMATTTGVESQFMAPFEQESVHLRKVQKKKK